MAKRRTVEFYRNYTNRLVATMKPEPVAPDPQYEATMQHIRETIRRVRGTAEREHLDEVGNSEEWHSNQTQATEFEEISNPVFVAEAFQAARVTCPR